MRILFACERSAGHIFPALSIAKKMQSAGSQETVKSNNQIYFFVSSKLLKKYVKAEGFAVLGRHFAFRCLPLELAWRFFESIYIIFKVRPQRVIGFGGRDSFFLILLSSLFFINTVLYEPNLSFGRANRILAHFVKKILRGFSDNSFRQKSLVVGVPLRANLQRINKVQARKLLNFDQRPVIFCCGGSQGSAFINREFVKFAVESGQDCQFIHLTGPDKFLEIKESYNKINNTSFIRDFYYNVEVLYSAADVIVARAGAMTLAEITYWGLAALLIPHPGGFGHQIKNALYFRDRQAAIVCLEKDFSFDYFSGSLRQIISDQSLRQSLRDNARNIKLGVGFEEIDIKDYY